MYLFLNCLLFSRTPHACCNKFKWGFLLQREIIHKCKNIYIYTKEKGCAVNKFVKFLSGC